LALLEVKKTKFFTSRRQNFLLQNTDPEQRPALTKGAASSILKNIWKNILLIYRPLTRESPLFLVIPLGWQGGWGMGAVTGD